MLAVGKLQGRIMCGPYSLSLYNVGGEAGQVNNLHHARFTLVTDKCRVETQPGRPCRRAPRGQRPSLVCCGHKTLIHRIMLTCLLIKSLMEVRQEKLFY